MRNNHLQGQLGGAQKAFWPLQGELHETHRRLFALKRELAEKEDDVRRMSSELWQTAELATIGELAASIAHELNNPLATVILAIGSLFMDLPQGDPKRQSLEVIAREVGRMRNLIANLPQFGRSSQSKMLILDVQKEIERTINLIHYDPRKHPIVVMREFASNVPPVCADRQQLQQLFLNLFINAKDAMPQGGRLTVRVRLCCSEAESRRQKAETSRLKTEKMLQLPSADRLLPSILIEVADTGVGIPPEILPRVLEPFFTTKTEGKGAGLGLAICRRIVQEHHGTLNITSEVGTGTTVHIMLPATGKTNSAHPLFRKRIFKEEFARRCRKEVMEDDYL
jgi:signal transduction histidine kinase